VVFTFDPDEAGQRAASRAFAEEQRFAAQTFVAVAPDNLDPCDLRIHRGDEAVRQLIATRKPMFEFMIRRRLAGHDLETVEGRVAALRASAPVVAGIRDRALSVGYVRNLAGWLGMDPGEVGRAVTSAANTARRSEPRTEQDSRRPGDEPSEQPAPRGANLTELPTDPVTRMERDALMAILQYPEAVGSGLVGKAVEARFSNATLAVVRDAVHANLDHLSAPEWLQRVADDVPSGFGTLVTQLGVAPIPERKEQLATYCIGVVTSLVDRDLLRRKSEVLGAMQRARAEGDREREAALSRESAALESERRELRGE